eukprot:SAG25_NODE_13874_length_261_cov_2.641975_1_plen_33_part_01
MFLSTQGIVVPLQDAAVVPCRNHREGATAGIVR